jgi:hypothetical protein
MYAKIFAQIYDGTLCTNGPWQALVTFQQMLVLADQDGNVDMTAGAIARRTTIPLEIISLGIEELLKPDPESRTPSEEGRRLIPLVADRPWGWRIVNYKHYRVLKREEDRRDYHREYWRKNRSPNKQEQEEYSTPTQHVQPNQPIAEAEAEAEADTEKRKTKTTRLPALSKSDLVVSGLSEELAEAWIEHRKSRRAKLTKISWSALVREAGKAGWSMDDAVRKAIERNWTTFEAAWVQHNGNGRNVSGEPAWRTEQKERAKAFMPFSHAKPVSTLGEVIENDATRKLG